MSDKHDTTFATMRGRTSCTAVILWTSALRQAAPAPVSPHPDPRDLEPRWHLHHRATHIILTTHEVRFLQQGSSTQDPSIQPKVWLKSLLNILHLSFLWLKNATVTRGRVTRFKPRLPRTRAQSPLPIRSVLPPPDEGQAPLNTLCSARLQSGDCNL